jgi:phosphatidylglycerol:prolipoprotein diacylglycerol transferase
MCQTLFFIPHAFLGWPVFGAGWLLLIWCMLSVGVLIRLVRRQGWNADTRGCAFLLLIVAGVIWFVLPKIELVPPAGPPLGLPIRGYGVLMLVGMVAAVALAVREGQRQGIESETVFSLAMHLFVGGILGARLFYVVQYWPKFQRESVAATLAEIVNVTQGGLVVLGGFFGLLVAGSWFLRTRRLPVLAWADLAAPSLAAALALGRIGCLMNGCCYGGLCSCGLSFPPESPPYEYQRELGQFHGFTVGRDARTGAAIVGTVEPDGPAHAAGLRPGTILRAVTGVPTPSAQTAREVLGRAPPDLQLDTSQGRVRIAIGELPPRSRPVHPTQIYAAIDAALLGFLLWSWYPFRRRDGEVFAVMLTLYPVARILEESLRTDEPGRFGTPLTISQWLSVLLLLGATVLWVWLRRRPRGTVFATAAA